MAFNDFKSLLPYFKDVKRVVLEGWGESLLHENLIEIIKLIKAEKTEVGFVTSGKGLSEDYISELINVGIDFMGFSLSGATSETHNCIRVNSDLQTLIGHIQTFNKLMMNKKLKKPRLHIVYLMLKDNISEVPLVVDLAREIGIENVVLTNLIHITNQWQEEQRVFKCDRIQGFKGSKGVDKILKEAEIKAKKLRINLRRPPLSPVDVAVCEEDPLENLYISIDGEVSPCVYLYPPTSSPFKRIFCGMEHEVKKLSFGNIFREPFHNIWNRIEYTDFRSPFVLRKKRFEEIFSPLLSSTERLKRLDEWLSPEPPEHCKTCHKILGF